MKSKSSYVFKGKCLITFSIVLLISSMGLMTFGNAAVTKEYSFLYEQIDINNIATVDVAIKKDPTSKITTKLKLTETPYKLESTKEEQKPVVAPTRIWYLPTEQGYITQHPSYHHVALDITSPRGVYEAIYPVADGIISGIFTDSAGALIVTILHNVNGRMYTSQYVHLSSYAPGIYVGKPVTVGERIGQMGATGYSTGVHLHLTVMDCALFSPNDGNCSNLSRFYNYARIRSTQGFIGLQNLIYVPNRWYGR